MDKDEILKKVSSQLGLSINFIKIKINENHKTLTESEVEELLELREKLKLTRKKIN